MPAEKRADGWSGGELPLRGVIFILLALAFVSGFLTGTLTLLWFIGDAMW